MFITSCEGVPLARGPIRGQNRVRTQDAKPRSLRCHPVPTCLPHAGPSAWPSPTFPACCGASSALPPLRVELHPSKRYAEVLTPTTTGCNRIWKQGLYRGEQAMMRSEGWPEPNMTSVLIRGMGKQRHAQRKAKMDVMREGAGRHVAIRGTLHRPRNVWGDGKLEEARKDDPPLHVPEEVWHSPHPTPAVISHSWAQN